MKKIAIVTRRVIAGGIEKALISMLETMDENKVEVTLFVMAKGGEFEKFIPSWVKIKCLYGEEKTTKEKIINRINELLEKISNSKSQMSQYKAELIALSQQIESDKAKIKVQESELQKNLEDSDYIINNISISNYNYSNKNGNISTGIIIDIYI